MTGKSYLGTLQQLLQARELKDLKQLFLKQLFQVGMIIIVKMV